MEMRLLGGSEMILSPLRGKKEDHFIAIEILGHDVFEIEFNAAVEALGKELRSNGIHYLFHWPKLWPRNKHDTKIQKKFINSRWEEFKKTMQLIVGDSLPAYNSGIFNHVSDDRLKDLMQQLWK